MKKINNLLNKLNQSLKDKKEIEYFEIHVDRYQYILKKIAKYFSGKNNLLALDVGCYPPHLYDSLESLGFKTYGIASNHEITKRNNICSLNIETDTLPYADNTFDLVIFTEVLEHLKSDPSKFFYEINRVIKPNGIFIITTPNVNRSQNLFMLLSGKNIYFPLSQLNQSDISTGSIYHRHNREYTRSEVIQLLQNSGFQIKSKHYFISYTPFRKRNKNNPILIKMIKIVNYLYMLLFPMNRDTIFVSASKI